MTYNSGRFQQYYAAPILTGGDQWSGRQARVRLKTEYYTEKTMNDWTRILILRAKLVKDQFCVAANQEQYIMSAEPSVQILFQISSSERKIDSGHHI